MFNHLNFKTMKKLFVMFATVAAFTLASCGGKSEQKATEEVLGVAKSFETNSIHIEINGAGMGRDAFIRAIQASNLQIDSIKDTTSFAFGGVTLKKRRRV